MKRANVAPAILALVSSLLFSGCGGGATAIPASSAQPNVAAQSAASLQLIIPNAPPGANARRRPQFVSPSTQAAIASSSANGHTAQAVIDLSNQAPDCALQGTNRVCNVTVQVEIGAPAITLTTYDEAPINGAISPAAHILGTGTAPIPTTISGPIVIAIDAVVDGLGSLPGFTSLPADGETHTYGFVLNPTDFDNNLIVNGSSDPFANPITVTLAETGGQGHSQLVFDGTPGGLTATLTKSTDSVAVHYDGEGQAGYSFAVTFAASGLANMQTVISPLYVTSSSSDFASPTLALTGSADSATFDIQEYQAPPATAYSVVSVGCTNVASVSSVMPTAGINSFTIAGGNSSGTCSSKVSDGTSTVTLAITNTIGASGPPYIYVNQGSSNGPINGYSISQLAAYPTSSNIAPATTLTSNVTAGVPVTYGLAMDRINGLLWFINLGANGAIAYPMSTVGSAIAPQQVDIPTIGNVGGLIYVDSLADVYLTDTNNCVEIFAASMTTSETQMCPTQSTIYGMAADSGGNMYLSDGNNINVYPDPGPGLTGGVTPNRIIPFGQGNVSAVALDSAGRIYAMSPGGSPAGTVPTIEIFAAGTGSAASNTPLETISGSAAFPFANTSPVEPNTITLDSGGNLYVTDGPSIEIYKASSITAALGHTLSNPDAVVRGTATSMANANTGIAVH